jgi:GNAT superfamily N-acetyltransferase
VTGVAFATSEFYAVPATRDRTAEIQAFNETNPEYWALTHGHPPPPDDAAKAFDVHPPADMPYTDDLWFLVRAADSGEIVAQVAVATDLLAPQVFHLGFFLVATRLHGTGFAARLHAAYRDWAERSGARWLRLNVVAVNARGHAFWRRQGYAEVTRRDGYVLGERTHVVITMVQPVGAATLDEYLQRVPRDRPAVSGAAS